MNNISGTVLVKRMGEAIQELQQEHGVSEEDCKESFPHHRFGGPLNHREKTEDANLRWKN